MNYFVSFALLCIIIGINCSLFAEADSNFPKLPLTQEPQPGRPLNENDFAKGRELMEEALNSEDVDEDPTMSNETSLFEGDIIIPDSTLEEIRRHLVDNNTQTSLRRHRSALANPSSLWPNAVIYYMISSDFNDTERAIIAESVDAFHKETCIRFIPRKEEKDYVYIIKGRKCSSWIGRKGGRQDLVLNNTVPCIVRGEIMHELMHAAAFWHEQNRPDRDNYVEINFNNIIPGEEKNFLKYGWGYLLDLGIPYDKGSIMHYREDEFSKNGKPTIQALDGSKVGQRNNFSPSDIKKLNLLYKCGSRKHTQKKNKKKKKKKI